MRCKFFSSDIAGTTFIISWDKSLFSSEIGVFAGVFWFDTSLGCTASTSTCSARFLSSESSIFRSDIEGNAGGVLMGGLLPSFVFSSDMTSKLKKFGLGISSELSFSIVEFASIVFGFKIFLSLLLASSVLSVFNTSSCKLFPDTFTEAELSSFFLSTLKELLTFLRFPGGRLCLGG